MKRVWPLPAFLVLLVSAANAASPPDCFDAEISGRIVRQIPTVLPECGPTCIVMRWPWFLDLQVRRIHRGRVARGPLTVLSIQHTDYGDLDFRRWWLRRNDAGGFNLVPEDGRARPYCTAGTPPARAYIQPGPGKTLDDLRREGAAHYERQNG